MGTGTETQQTSPEGLAFLERHEGVVLRAYRDVVGVWTIGAGLTAASGVVKPQPAWSSPRMKRPGFWARH